MSVYSIRISKDGKSLDKEIGADDIKGGIEDMTPIELTAELIEGIGLLPKTTIEILNHNKDVILSAFIEKDSSVTFGTTEFTSEETKQQLQKLLEMEHN